ncbi:MAG: peptidoglycan DD-metalloendopeptidase family protein [Acidimicrobiia bacterium]
MRSRVGCIPKAIGATVCVALVAVALPPLAGAAPTRWLLPVDGPIARPFRAPVGQYASGHRGVDLVAAPGTGVRAANDGVVVFAGSVAGALHVVVAHDGGIRTSSSFLERVDVRVGQRVSRGTVIGAAGGTGDGHGAGVLHLGVRVGERYIDPMLLFGEVDLTAIVRLVPVSAGEIADATTTAAERAAIVEEFLDEWDDEGCAGALGEIGFLAIGDVFNGACDGLVSVAHAGLDAMRWVGGQVAAVAEAIADTVHGMADLIATAGKTIAEAAVALAGAAADAAVATFVAIARLGAMFFDALTACPQPKAKRHGAGSGNLALAVAGLGSSRRRRADGSVSPSMHVDHEVLGYRTGEVTYFSYEGDAPTYGYRETFGDLHAQARSLGEQLRTLASLHPGRAVDLIGHSQGGVVIALFLLEHYRGHEDEYPPIPNVVTFASPLEGTPTATLASRVNDTVGGRSLFTAVERVRPDLPLGTKAIDQLDEESPTIEGLTDASFARGPRFLSIMATADVVVPSTSGDIEGGEKVVVPVGNLWPFGAHGGILHDDDALSAAQAQLAGGSPAPCGPFVGVLPTLYSEVVRFGTELTDSVPVNAPIPAGL